MSPSEPESPLQFFFLLFFLFGCSGSLWLPTDFGCGEPGPLLVAVHGLLTVLASRPGEHGLSHMWLTGPRPQAQ